MAFESRTWQQLKDNYLSEVERALLSVRHPQVGDVLDEMDAHLDRRRAELGPGGQTADNFRAIIAEMALPYGCAEWLESGRRTWLPWRVCEWVRLAIFVAGFAAALFCLTLRVVDLVRGPGAEFVAQELATEGARLLVQEKFTQAEEVFRRAIEKDPTNTDAWSGLGWAQSRGGKPAGAMASFERCLAIDSEYTDALKGLATTYMEMELYAKAFETYKRWLQVEPGNIWAQVPLEQVSHHDSGQ